MPYITPEDRSRVVLGTFVPAVTAGELSYQFSVLIKAFLQNITDKNANINYQSINDVVGALEGTKHEFQRCVADEYEAAKQKLNGDVWL